MSLNPRLHTITSVEATLEQNQVRLFIWSQKCYKINITQEKMGKNSKRYRLKRNSINFDLSFSGKRLKVFVMICVISI